MANNSNDDINNINEVSLIVNTRGTQSQDQIREEETPLETCGLNRTYSRTLSRQKSHVYSATSRPSLISHHMITYTDDTDEDRVDALPEHMTFTILDAVAILFSIGSFLLDIGTDIAVAAYYYITDNNWYFYLTLTFVILPTLVMTGISLRWYVVDSREEGSPKITPFQWILRVIFLLLQLGPILRYFDSLMYGLKFRQASNSKEAKKKYFQYMVYEDTDATMLRLFECFMEAAPQLVLQLYILIKNFNTWYYLFWIITISITSCLASLVSVSWSLVSYHRALRLSLPDKANMKWTGLAIQFIWRFFMVASRVVTLSLFASQFRFYISIVCSIHWFLMFLWIVSMRTSFCKNRIEELGYNAILAFIFIFCYFNPVDTPTRRRYILYYLFMFCENIIILTLWYFNCPESEIYKPLGFPAFLISFTLGIAFMVVYYLWFHPSKIMNCRNNDDNSERRESSLNQKMKRTLHATQGLWTTQGRLLHPRPAVPTSFSDSKINKKFTKNLKDDNNGSVV
ncbi:XK-related protein 4-like [Oppia nitens]|uniref:XK-related protein 4-like n=1 Tax=Oppia nitens TaxID=1686743 RepID=UPI0023DA3337|nr:XK-related protein 4-like [Oppia nitens]